MTRARSRKRGPAGPASPRGAALALAVIACLAFALGLRHGLAPVATRLPSSLARGGAARGGATGAEPPAPVPPVASSPGPLVSAGPLPRALASVVIDDCGQSLERERPFLALGWPIGVAVLPHLPDSRAVAEEAAARGLCVLLHLPMESQGGRDPGPGALRRSMSGEEIRRVLEEDLASVPFALGLNNHEGSEGTRDPRLVELVLEAAAERGLLVLDSRTSPQTRLGPRARERGLATLSRRVFLDHEDDTGAILARLEELGTLALREGSAVALGHPRPRTLEALRRGLPELGRRGVELVSLKEMMDAGPKGSGPPAAGPAPPGASREMEG